MRILALLAMVAIARSPGQAQQLQLGSAAGLTASSPELGLHLAINAETAIRNGPIAVRVDAVFQQHRLRDIFAFANLRITPWHSSVAPYGIAGVGAFFDNGVNRAWNAGVGVDINRFSRFPAFTEYRLILGREQYSHFSIGVHFPIAR